MPACDRRLSSVAQPTGSTLSFGDAHAQVYALDVNTGQRRWKVKVDEHLDAMITGAAAFHNGRLYVPVSSLEEGTAAIPTYECCTFRGSVVALDAASGKQTLEDLHDSSSAAANDKDCARHATVGTVGRGRVVAALGRRRTEPNLHLDGRRLFEPRAS